MLIALIRPFSHLTREDMGGFDPKERCYAHASSLMLAIWTFRAFAILRFEYYLVHPLSSAAFIVLGDLDHGPAQTDTLIRACHCLYEMTSNLPLADDCLLAINGAFKRSRQQLPPYVLRYYGSERQRRGDGLMHHAHAALIPTTADSSFADCVQSLSFQELLDGLDDIVPD
jgi:hypothetical protein